MEVARHYGDDAAVVLWVVLWAQALGQTVMECIPWWLPLPHERDLEEYIQATQWGVFHEELYDDQGGSE